METTVVQILFQKLIFLFLTSLLASNQFCLLPWLLNSRIQADHNDFVAMETIVVLDNFQKIFFLFLSSLLASNQLLYNFNLII